MDEPPRPQITSKSVTSVIIIVAVVVGVVVVVGVDIVSGRGGDFVMVVVSDDCLMCLCCFVLFCFVLIVFYD